MADAVEPIKTEELHPAYVAHELALKAWADAVNAHQLALKAKADAVNADRGLLAFQRLSSLTASHAKIERLRKVARLAYRAWKAAGIPLYAIKKPTT